MVPGRLTPKQWMLLVRCHWGVENNNHTFDTAFAEDTRPWIETDANGMLAVLLLRRIAYTMLALFRAVSLRSDANRATRWKDLLAWVRDTLVAAQPEHMTNLRVREVCAARRTLICRAPTGGADIAGREEGGPRGQRQPTLAAACPERHVGCRTAALGGPA